MALCVNVIVFPANLCRSWRSSENARHLRKYWKNVISSVREFMSLTISMMCRLISGWGWQAEANGRRRAPLPGINA
jgi:hypothetical protein